MKIKLLFAALLIAHLGFTQEQVLPNQMTPDEVQNIESYNQSRQVTGITTPPGSSVRTMAEWEEIQSLVIAWEGYPTILSQITDIAQDECEVIIVCDDSNNVKTELTNNGVPLHNVSYIQQATNSIWMRDYGGNTVYKNEVDSLYLVDWIYNRPRPADDNVPDAVAAFKNIPLYQTTAAPYSLVHTGGNFMTDGFGTGFSSKLVLDENAAGGLFNPENLTEAQIDQRMNLFMGIDKYIKMEVLPYDGIHHIDMHMKLLDEETLLVSEYPMGVADGPQIELNLDDVLNNYHSTFGTPYEVVRIPVPPSTSGAYPDNGGYYRTYTNQVFVNKTIIVPTYRTEYDTIALRILRDAMPGYKVIGIDCDTHPNNIIQLSGAIHCITRAVGVAEPLLISHQRLRDTDNTTTPYTVSAYMNHISGIVSATLYWTTDTTSGYTAVSMSNVGNGNWEAQIPAQPINTQVYYYVKGQANSGKQQVRPIVAPAGYWKFNVISPNSIEEADVQVGIDAIFPNPSSTIACISVSVDHPTQAKMEVFNMVGRSVQLVHQGVVPMGKSKYFIKTEVLPIGVYMVVLKVAGQTQVQKLVVK
ncbi:agmatine deiminase family protein [bacterium SCSIO 12643]|nr:agmatine deiminase family protein [bacterium SCSIO 12643]